MSNPSIPSLDNVVADSNSQQDLSIMLKSKPSLVRHFPTVYRPPKITLKLSENHAHFFSNTAQLYKEWPANLGEKLAGDVAIAAAVTAAAAPFLTVIDKALVQYSAGSHSLNSSIRSSVQAMVQHPVHYLKSPTFLWMWATYASTYAVANSLRTVTEHAEYRQAKTVAAAAAKTKKQGGSSQASTMAVFAGTTAMNASASMLKDRAYARMFGNAGQAAAAVPVASYAFWLARDFTTIGSSFILPAHVAAALQWHCDMAEPDAVKVAQLATPVAAQLVAGPLHYVGLDCYNRPSAGQSVVTVADRARFLYQGFAPVVAARMVRILPGYGIAGVYNTKFRSEWRDYLIQRQVRRLLQSRGAATPAATETMGIQSLVALIRAKRQA